MAEPAAQDRLDRTSITVRAGPLVGPVLARVVAVHAARVPFGVDRVDDAVLIADAVAARAPAFCVDDRLPVSVQSGADQVELRVGPLRAGGGRRVLEGAGVPGAGNVIEKLADVVKVRDGSGGGEYLVIRIVDASAAA